MNEFYAKNLLRQKILSMSAQISYQTMIFFGRLTLK